MIFDLSLTFLCTIVYSFRLDLDTKRSRMCFFTFLLYGFKSEEMAIHLLRCLSIFKLLCTAKLMEFYSPLSHLSGCFKDFSFTIEPKE